MSYVAGKAEDDLIKRIKNDMKIALTRAETLK